MNRTRQLIRNAQSQGRRWAVLSHPTARHTVGALIGTMAQCRVRPAAGAPRAVSRLPRPRPAPRCSAQAPLGAVATATGRFPLEPRLRQRGCARRGRCGRAGAARRATAVGARRARGRAGGRGGAQRRTGTPTLARGAACKVGEVGGGQSRERGGAACGVRLRTWGDPVASSAGECRLRTPRAGPAPPRASAARACLGIAPCRPGLTFLWPGSCGLSEGRRLLQRAVP